MNKGEEDYADEIRRLEPHNLTSLSIHSVLVRFAWIFKTESVIIPAFLDSIAGAGWLRGFLPVLNRFGQSLPPIFFAKRLRNQRVKKWSLIGTSSGMGLSMIAVAALWTAVTDRRQMWMSVAFLGLYLLFFAANGLNQQVFGTLQGKLIRPERRGELLGISGIGGSIASIVGAWFLLQRWLNLPDHGFGYIFGFSGFGFLIAGFASCFVHEPPDRRKDEPPRGDSINSELNEVESGTHNSDGIGGSLTLFLTDRNFRRLAIVAMLFISIQLLFPHFQALGQQQISKDQIGFQLMLWVIVQNMAVGLFSYISGKLADQFGNRLSLRLLIFGTALVPLLALSSTNRIGGMGPDQYWITFFFIGLTPVTIKTLTNYALELTEPAKHPLYVATLHACLALPFLFSPLVGWLVDLFGFHRVFLGVSMTILLGAIATFFLIEPRAGRYSDVS